MHRYISRKQSLGIKSIDIRKSNKEKEYSESRLWGREKEIEITKIMQKEE